MFHILWKDKSYQCYSAEKLMSGKNIVSQGKFWEKSGKMKTNGHPAEFFI